MPPEPSIFARVLDFVGALLPYWWLLVTGGLLAIEPLMEAILPQRAKTWLESKWPKNRRHQHFRVAAVAALLIAAFLAYDDVAGRNHKLQSDYSTLSGAKTAAEAERDEGRRQYAKLLDLMNTNEKKAAAIVPPNYTILAPSTPQWLKTAYKEIGVREIPGPQENPRIVEYFKSIGAKEYQDDVDDWASAFVEWSLNQADIHGPKDDDPFSWLSWGQELDRPVIGCVMVMSFSGLRHVGFYFGDDGDFVRVLGGNEDDSVNLFRYPRSSVFGCRWPPNQKIPDNH